MLEGVACLPGIDTLLLLLLADLGDARQVAAFAAMPSQVDVAAVAPRLQVRGLAPAVLGGGVECVCPAAARRAMMRAAWLYMHPLLHRHHTPSARLPTAPLPQAEQWHHALATLHAARGAADGALHIWRQVADGQLAAPADPALQAAERREALESAAALLRDPGACPEATLVSHIPWLLGSSQPAALGVLTARALTPAAVLPLLPPESDVRWQYLAHLLYGGEGTGGEQGTASSAAASSGGLASSGAASDPALHTELATQLAAAILRADPALCSPAPPAGSPLRRTATLRSSASGGPGRTPGRSSSTGGGGGPRRRASRASTAALVSGGSVEPWEGASLVDAMRLRLRAHLEASSLYDAAAVLRSLQGSGLHEELVVLHAKASRGAGQGWDGWAAGEMGSGCGARVRMACGTTTCPALFSQDCTSNPNLLHSCLPPRSWETTWPRCACWPSRCTTWRQPRRTHGRTCRRQTIGAGARWRWLIGFLLMQRRCTLAGLCRIWGRTGHAAAPDRGHALAAWSCFSQRRSPHPTNHRQGATAPAAGARPGAGAALGRRLLPDCRPRQAFEQPVHRRCAGRFAGSKAVMQGRQPPGALATHLSSPPPTSVRVHLPKYNSAGDHLDPQEVLQALPPGMPLAAAAAVLAPMLRDRVHRRRQVRGAGLGFGLRPVGLAAVRSSVVVCSLQGVSSAPMLCCSQLAWPPHQPMCVPPCAAHRAAS